MPLRRRRAPLPAARGASLLLRSVERLGLGLGIGLGLGLGFVSAVGEVGCLEREPAQASGAEGSRKRPLQKMPSVMACSG